MLDQIFICDTLEDGQSHFHVRRKDLPTQPQVVLMDETNNTHFFKESSIPKMKRFLEGEGIATDEKWGSVGIQFRNCSIIMASNDLPFDKMSEIDSFALRQRIVVCKLPMRSHSLNGTFPFTARQLADFFISQYELLTDAKDES